MIRHLLIFIFLFSPAWGTTYYVADSTNGSAVDDWGNVPSDSMNGLSWDSAWASITKLNSTMSEGDTVYFATGIWYFTQILPPEYGNSTDWTLYACSSFSAVSDEDKLAGKFLPKLYGGTLVADWVYYDTINAGDTIWKAEYSDTGSLGDNQCYTLGQDDTLLLVPQDDLTTGGVVDKLGEMFHDLNADTIYALLYGGANPNDCIMVASIRAPLYMRLQYPNCVKFWGLELKYGKQGVIHLGARNDSIKIEHCHVAMVGMKDHENPAVIFCNSSSSNSAEDCGVVACSLGWALNENSGSGAQAGYDPPRNGYGHGGIIDLYSHEHFHADSNYIYGYGNLGVCFKNSPGGCCYPWTGNVVRFNTITNVVDGINFYNYPDRDSAYGNVITDCYQYGITIQSGSGNDPDYYEGKFFIANNTIYDIDVAHINLRGGETELCGSDNEVKYNVCQKWNQESGPDDESYLIGFSNQADDTCEYSYTIDSNIYYDPDTLFAGRCTDGGVTWASWTSVCGRDDAGFDVHSEIVDPGFNDPANGDFSRPTAFAGAKEMDINYGGRIWKYYGAIQEITAGNGLIIKGGKITGVRIR